VPGSAVLGSDVLEIPASGAGLDGAEFDEAELSAAEFADEAPAKDLGPIASARTKQMNTLATRRREPGRASRLWRNGNANLLVDVAGDSMGG